MNNHSPCVLELTKKNAWDEIANIFTAGDALNYARYGHQLSIVVPVGFFRLLGIVCVEHRCGSEHFGPIAKKLPNKRYLDSICMVEEAIEPIVCYSVPTGLIYPVYGYYTPIGRPRSCFYAALWTY